jgi:hypothetical protein
MLVTFVIGACGLWSVHPPVDEEGVLGAGAVVVGVVVLGVVVVVGVLVVEGVVAPAAVVALVLANPFHTPFTFTSSATLYVVEGAPFVNAYDVPVRKPEFSCTGSTQTLYPSAPATAVQPTLKPLEVTEEIDS